MDRQSRGIKRIMQRALGNMVAERMYADFIQFPDIDTSTLAHSNNIQIEYGNLRRDSWNMIDAFIHSQLHKIVLYHLEGMCSWEFINVFYGPRSGSPDWSSSSGCWGRLP